MAFLFDNFVKRIEYISTIKSSSSEVELNSSSVANAVQLARAFELFPNRNEVPFLVYKNSRALDAADNTVFFVTYMNDFVTALKRSPSFEKTLFSNVSDGEATNEQGQLFYLYSVLQANYKSTGRNEVLKIISTMENIPLSIQMFREIILLEKQPIFQKIDIGIENKHPLAKVKNSISEVEKKELLAQINRFDQLIKNINNSTTDDVLTVIGGHILQQLFDGKSALIIARTLFDKTQKDMDKSIDEFLKEHRSVLNLRKSLAEPNSVLWFTTPRSMISYHLFEHAAGSHNHISDDTISLINYLAPKLIESWKAEIFDQPAFKELKDLEFWRYGTPSSLAFRGLGTHQLINEWLKENW